LTRVVDIGTLDRVRIALIALVALLLATTPRAVSAPLNGPTTPVLDTFDGRGSEDPLAQSGNWAPHSIDGSGPTLEILDGAVGHDEGGNADAGSYRAADATGDVVEAYATIVAAPADVQDLYLYVNLQDVGTPNWDGYRARWFHWADPDGLALEKVVNGVASHLAAVSDVEPIVGDRLLLRNDGGTIELWHESGGAWIRRLSAADGSFQGGKIGLGTNDEVGRWDDFGGTEGTTTTSPPPPPASGVLDDFERPNEDPLSQSGNWAPLSIDGSGPTLEVRERSASHDEGDVQGDSFRSHDLPAGDAEVFGTIAVVPDDQRIMSLYLSLREAGTPGVDGYEARWFHWIARDGVYIRKIVDGVSTNLPGSPVEIADEPIAGDVLLFRRVGDELELWHKRGATSVLRLKTSDGSYHGGRLGLGTQGIKARWDDFGGGALGAPPPPPPPPPSDDPPLEQSQGICTGRGVHAIATSRCLSDPVNTLTGAFVTSVEDLAVPGTGVDFAWSRTYTSSDTTSGRLGIGWTDSYDVSLDIEPNGDVRLHGDEGQIVLYEKQPDGTFVGAPGSLSTLRALTNAYMLTRSDQVLYWFDVGGRLLSQRDRNGRGLDFTYDASGRLTRVTNGAGTNATISYDAAGLVTRVAEGARSVDYIYADGRLVSMKDVRGQGTRFLYDSVGRLEAIHGPNGREITNVYGPDGRVRSQVDALGHTTTFAWDESTQTATVTDANGNAWRDDYGDNVLVERVDPLGNATTFAHDSDLNASGVTSPTGETTSMTYDARGNLLSATAPASLGGAQKTFVCNARNDPTRVTDARGTVTTYTYDPDGNTERVVQDGTQISAYTYDANGNVLTATDANSKATTYTYDANGNLASETDPLGNTTTYTYDDAGRVLTRVDPRGNTAGANPADFTWRWTYDAAGNVLTERDPLGAVTTHTYDDVGNELTTTDAGGRTTTFAYDKANRLISETRPDPDGAGPLPAPVTTYAYDEVGNKVAQTDALGRTTTFAYDAANRLVSTTGPDPDGAGPLAAPVSTTSYDDNGNPASTVEPRGNVGGANPDDFRTRFAYDAAGRLLTTTDPLGNTSTNAYDSVGNLTSMRDANGHTTVFTYDRSGPILTVTGADGEVTAYTYDDAGNRLTRRDANGHVTTYAYDAAGQLVTESGPDPDGPGPKGPAVATRTYDPNGNLESTVDPNGNATATAGDGRTSFAYDAANRLVAIDYSDATPDVTFAYDAVGNRVSMSDGSGTETRTYDALSRLTAVTRGADTFSYSYDAVGNVTRRSYPGGTSIDYVYDGLSRLASVATGGQTTTYGYDVASNLTQTVLPTGNGHVETRAYDRAGRLTEVTSRRGTTTLAGFVATLDAVGNPTQIARTGALTQTQTFAYDPNDRLVSVCFQTACAGSQDPFIRWAYDGVGNRLSEQRPTGTTSYTYDAADRLLQAGSTAYTFDENGNQLSAGSRTFTYDLANRLKTTRSGSTTTTYAYDGDGARLQASTGTSSSSTTRFLWDVSHPLPELALERSGSGSLLRRYVYGSRRISMTAGSSTSYFHHDGLGSVANVTSSSGSRRWTYAYEPFGRTRTEQRSGDSAPTNFMKFTGEYLDPTGLYHLRARQYDPALGRFATADPESLPTGTPGSAPYAYVANRPTVLHDPSGRVFRPIGESVDAAEFAGTHASMRSPLDDEGVRRCITRGDVFRARIVREARSHLTKPYVFGTAGPRTFDCSGLVKYVYEKIVGHEFAHFTGDQVHYGRAASRTALKPGDIVFFHTVGTNSHNGIYVGDGRFIHAPHTGDVVKYSSLNQSYYRSHYSTARRIIRCENNRLVTRP
jgi:RHS repeat-associated protein